jgi:hypothetical protein
MMTRTFTLAALALVVVLAPARAAGVNGLYVEARTCDIWTGPCFANAEFGLTGHNAILAWKIEAGEFDNVALDGLGIVAVVAASDTLGTSQTGPAKAVLIVDSRASAQQRDALVRLARRQAGDLLADVVAVQSAEVNIRMCECKEGGCAEVQAGKATVKTRCINAKHDKICGNETAYYPPLAQDVNVQPAAAVEHGYRGTGLAGTWRETERRGAYVGTFALR